MKQTYLFATLSAIGYSLIAYVIPREQFGLFFTVYAALFFVYIYWWRQLQQEKIDFDTKTYFYLSMALRALFIVSMPLLSDDFWRYIWDGRLLANGLNPYAYLPTAVNDMPYLAPLFDKINSPKFYTVYPPIMQLIGGIGAFIVGNNVWGHVIIFHLLILLFEVGTFRVLLRIFEKLKISSKRVFLYAFNPLVIVELMGNLHTEYAMIFFMALAVYWLLDERYTWSAFAFAAAVLAKLIPLLLLPLFFNRLRWTRGLEYGIIVTGVTLLCYFPFIDLELLYKIKSAATLYFAHFEFNASIYYVLRYFVFDEYWTWWDYHDSFRGISWIEEGLRLEWYVIIRKVLPIIDVLLILGMSFIGKIQSSNKVFFSRMLWIYTIHFLLATTIHPWYITPLVLFTVWTSRRFVILWSGLIAMTYISYNVEGFEEQTWVILVEYLLILLFFCQEKFQIIKLSKKNET